MPIMDGYETTKWLRENHPNIKILILTMFDSEIALIRLLKSGVRGFLKKDAHPAELKAALLSRKDVFIRNLTSKLLGYALGRSVMLSDQPLLDEMLNGLKRNDDRLSVAVNLIVQSKQFRYHRGLEATKDE